MWIHPPGPSSIPLAAFFLTVLGRPFVRAGGTGDLRSYQNSFLAALGLAASAGLLILTTPFLTDYPVMNLAILPAEALHASRQIRIAGCTQQEKARLAAWNRALQTLVTRTTVLISCKHILPEIAEAILRPRFERPEVEFKQMLDAFAECLRQGDCRRELPSLRRASGEMDGALESIRQSEILNGSHPEAPERVLELVDHYHATGEALEKCRRLIGTLKIHHYWGHCGL